MKTKEEQLKEYIDDDYWLMMDELWHDFMDLYGYLPLGIMINTREFQVIWMEKVQGN